MDLWTLQYHILWSFLQHKLHKQYFHSLCGVVVGSQLDVRKFSNGFCGPIMNGWRRAWPVALAMHRSSEHHVVAEPPVAACRSGARSWQSLESCWVGGLVVRLHGFGPASGIGSATHGRSRGLCVVILVEAFCGCPRHLHYCGDYVSP